jgi:hypothetical protein
VDRLPVRLLERVVRWSALALASAVLGAAFVSSRAAVGLALGGAISLGSLALHWALVAAWVRPLRRRRAKVGFWAVWLVKWPLIGVALFLALKGGWVAPGWLCAGVGVVPAMATGLALKALLLDSCRRGRRERC